MALQIVAYNGGTLRNNFASGFTTAGHARQAAQELAEHGYVCGKIKSGIDGYQFSIEHYLA